MSEIDMVLEGIIRKNIGKVLAEGRGVDKEYHFTTLECWERILSDDAFKLSDAFYERRIGLWDEEKEENERHVNAQRYPYYLSMTRNRNSRVGYSRYVMGKEEPVRIEMDVDALRALPNATIYPHSYFDTYGASAKQRMADNGMPDSRIVFENQSEDRLVSGEPEIRGAVRLVRRVDILVGDRPFHYVRFYRDVAEAFGETYFYLRRQDFDFQRNGMKWDEFARLHDKDECDEIIGQMSEMLPDPTDDDLCEIGGIRYTKDTYGGVYFPDDLGIRNLDDLRQLMRYIQRNLTN